MFPKLALPKASGSPLLIGVAGSQYTNGKATKSEFLTKFLKSAVNLTENFQEKISNGVRFQKFTDVQTAGFSLVCFKNF